MIKCMKHIRREQQGPLLCFLLNLVEAIFIWYFVCEEVEEDASNWTVMDLGQLYLILSELFPLSLSPYFPVESDGTTPQYMFSAPGILWTFTEHQPHGFTWTKTLWLLL